MYVLFADTDTDITPEIAEKYGYNLISMPYSIDGNTVYPYVDFEQYDYHTFFNVLRSGVIPTTSAISTEQYIEYFEPFFKNGQDILYVHFSSAMTMTFNNMRKAVDILWNKYPDRRFYEVDTKCITTACMGIIREIGDMYIAGKTAEEIVEWSKKEVDKYTMYFFADDLRFFKHSGRVSGLTAAMGTMLGIRPIIYMDNEGKMVSVGKEKGRIKALERLLKYVEDLGEDIKEHYVYIGHSDCLDIAEELGNMMKQKFGDDLKIEYSVVNPTAGSHCGPNGVGVCFHAKHR